MTIIAQGYKDIVATFIPSQLEEGSSTLKQIPSYVKLNNENTYKTGERVVIDVEEAFNSDYKNKIQEVVLNNNEVEFKNCKDKLYSIEIDRENFNQVGDYNIVLKSSGYEDFKTKLKYKMIKINSREEVSLLDNKVNMEYNSFSKKFI